MFQMVKHRLHGHCSPDGSLLQLASILELALIELDSQLGRQRIGCDLITVLV